jgi:hypothetical protein
MAIYARGRSQMREKQSAAASTNVGHGEVFVALIFLPVARTRAEKVASVRRL